MPEKKSWKMPGCRGRFYLRGKKKIIWYEAHDKPRSMRLVFSHKNKQIAGETIKEEENPLLFKQIPWSPKTILTAYKEFRDAAKRTKKMTTIKHYDYAIKASLNIDHFLMYTDDIKNNIEEMLYSSLKNYLPITIRAYLRVLRSFFHYCIKQGWMEDNPVDRIMMPKVPEKAIEIFSDDELQKIFAYFEKTDYLFYLYIKFLYKTAFRRNEPLNINISHVLLGNDFRKEIILKSSKFGDRPETFPLTEPLQEIIKQLPAYKEKQGNLFPYTDGMKLSKKFAAGLTELGFHTTIYAQRYKRCLHTLRKTRITNWIQKDKVDPYTLVKLSRDNIATVMKYYALLDMDDYKQFVK